VRVLRGRALADRRVALLALAAVAYGIAAWMVTPGFFDGIAPPSPYRWVSPPPQFKSSNQPPQSGQGTVKVASNAVVDPGTAFTQDGQASVSFVPGAFVAPHDHSAVSISVKPVAQFPNPSGIHLATNVYCFTSSSPLASGQQALITLRYSDGVPAPGDVYGYEGQGPWRKLGNTGSASPYTISVRVSSLSCYAAGFPSNAQSAPGARVSGGQTLPILVALVILLIVLAGIPLAVLRRRGEPDTREEDPSGGPPTPGRT
jgi:hypothetical protein